MRPVLQALRSEAGEQMVLQDNFFIEKVLPGAILRKLSDEEMAEYRRPFAQPGESRRPTLTWPREIPIEGDPADVTAIVDAYAEWPLTGSSDIQQADQSRKAVGFLCSAAELHGSAGGMWWSASLGPSAYPAWP
jgi:hypothetical protein